MKYSTDFDEAPFHYKGNYEAATNTMQVWDKVLGTLLILSTLVGVPGNLLSLRFFWRSGKRSLSNLLYITICSVDVWTCIAHIPVTLSLFSHRKPVLFSNKMLRNTWFILYSDSQYGSMFLVVLMSVARTTSIVLPFLKPKKHFALVAFFAFEVVLTTYNVVITSGNENGAHVAFASNEVHCMLVDFRNGTGSSIVLKIDTVVVGFMAGTFPLICFVSFVICYKKLAATTVSTNSNQENKKKATSTIALFTATFLLCNLPVFICHGIFLMGITFHPDKSYPEPYFTSVFMGYYAWLIVNVYCPVLNATLNPILYWCRFSVLTRRPIGTINSCPHTVIVQNRNVSLPEKICVRMSDLSCVQISDLNSDPINSSQAVSN